MEFNNLFKLTQLLFIFFYTLLELEATLLKPYVFDDYLGDLHFIDNRIFLFQKHKNTSFRLKKNETRRRMNYHFVIS
jgi:hypothetical protein